MSENQSYGADNIQELQGLEAIRNTPGMYIGSTNETGLHHMVQELIDNSVDEAMEGHADDICVRMHEDGSVSVEDNGRGIPIQEKDNGEPAVNVIMTKIHAGGKFDSDAYEFSGGLHGVGVSVVNALSNRVEVTVRKRGHVWKQIFIEGEPQGLEKVREMDSTESNGTIVRFWPDGDIFETTVFSYDKLRKRVENIAYLNPNIRFSIEEIETEQKEEFLFEKGIREFILNQNTAKETLHDDVIELHGREETEQGEIVEVDIALQYTESTNTNIFSFANNIETPEGGTHETGFKTSMTRLMNKHAERIGELSNIDSDRLGGDVIRDGLTAIINVKHSNPEFEGQTKGKLGNSDARGVVSSIVTDQLDDYLEKHPDTTESIIRKIIRAHKAKQAAQKAEELERKSATTNTRLPGKLADCQKGTDPEDAELFIVEGDSAGGCFTGDTKVQLASGKEKTFKEIIEENEKGKNHYCYTVMNDGSIGIEKIENPRRTKKDASLVRVELNNGEKIKCTPDHKFMLRSGEYKEAQELESGDSLMPLYTKKSNDNDEGITINGYKMVKQPNRSNFWEFVHRLADRYNLHNNIYDKDDGENRHHVDFDKLNNSPENIVRMSDEEHMSVHNNHLEDTLHTEEAKRKSKEVRRTDEYREMMSNRMKEEGTSEVLSKQAKEQWNNEEYVQYMVECFLDYYEENSDEIDRRLAEEARKYWSKEENRKEKSKEMEQYYEDNPEAVEQRRKEANELWNDEEMREWRSKETKEQWDKEFREQRMETYNQTYFENTIPLMKEYYEQEGTLDGYDEFRSEEGNLNTLTLDTTIEKFFDNEDELVAEIESHNHSVKKVVEIDETADVYDIEVPGTHNFALSSGVFVHNSAKQARNPETQAILPLRGKILNAEKNRLNKILEHDQIRNLITALGTNINEEFNIEDLRYHTIIIFVDADVDGAHIKTLLLTFIFRYLPELLENGHVYAARPPLYRIKNNGETYDVMTEEERDKVVEEKCNGNPDNVQRFKGLGEMNPQQLWDTTMNPENRILEQITIENAKKADQMFSVLMGSKVQPRKEFIKNKSDEADWVDI